MLELFDTSTISLVDLVINLVIGAGLSFLLSIHFVLFGRTLSNRTQLARTIPFIALTTLLVITIVKSSLALSLGLVGALSIVRFRTPIKEPEELAYIFLAIAVGLGLGADQRETTVVAFGVITGFMLVPQLFGRRWTRTNTFMRMELTDVNDPKLAFDGVVDEISKHVQGADLRRVDLNGSSLDIMVHIAAKRDRDIVAVMDGLRRLYPQANITFVEQDSNLDL